MQAGPYTPEVAVEHPEALRQLHREFLRAGADVLQALTFYASKEKLGTAGYADQVEAINRAAVRIANEVAGDQALVAGTLCLTWMYDPKDPGSRAVVRRLFDEQIAVQAAEGVDFFIGETFTFLEEARQCLHAIKAAGFPAMITFTVRDTETAEGVPARRGHAHPGGRGRGHPRGELRPRPRADAPDRRARCARRRPATWRPSRSAFRTRDDLPNFTQLPEFPLALDSLTLSRAEMGDLRDPGARARGQLHRLLLRLGRPPRARDGRGARAAPAGERQVGRPRPASRASRRAGPSRRWRGVKPKSADAPRFATGDRNW